MAGPTTAAWTGYEGLLAKVTQLEVDLSQAVQALERTQSDNIALKEVQAELQRAYQSGQDQRARLWQQLRRDQESLQQLREEHSCEVEALRGRLEQALREPAREPPREQQRAAEPSAAESSAASRLKSSEEARADLERRLQEEARRAAKLQRQLELQRAESETREQELSDERREITHRYELRETALQSRASELQSQLGRLSELEVELAGARAQLREQEATTATLKVALQDHQRQSEQELAAAALEAKAAFEDASVARRRAHELQCALSQQEHKAQRSSTEAEAARQERSRLRASLQAAEIRLAAPPVDEGGSGERACHACSAAAQERERLAQAMRDAEERAEAAARGGRRAEAKLQQAQEELAAQAREAEEAREARLRLEREAVALRARLDTLQLEAEGQRRSSREREASLTSQLHEREDELGQCRDSQEATQAELTACRRQVQQGRQSTKELQERLEQLERIHSEQGEELAVARQQLLAEEEQHRAVSRAMKVDLATTSLKLDEERVRWSREAVEARRVAQEAADARLAAALQLQSQEHSRQMAALRAASKKALRGTAGKREEQKRRTGELLQQVEWLGQEKAVAIRVCQENKTAYEQRLREISLRPRHHGYYVHQSAADAARQRDILAASETLAVQLRGAGSEAAGAAGTDLAAIASAPAAWATAAVMAQAAQRTPAQQALQPASNVEAARPPALLPPAVAGAGATAEAPGADLPPSPVPARRKAPPATPSLLAPTLASTASGSTVAPD